MSLSAVWLANLPRPEVAMLSQKRRIRSWKPPTPGQPPSSDTPYSREKHLLTRFRLRRAMSRPILAGPCKTCCSLTRGHQSFFPILDTWLACCLPLLLPSPDWSPTYFPLDLKPISRGLPWCLGANCKRTVDGADRIFAYERVQPTPTTFFLLVWTRFGGKLDSDKRHIIFVAVRLGVFKAVGF